MATDSKVGYNKGEAVKPNDEVLSEIPENKNPTQGSNLTHLN
jgi:hypothetical protein